ncbi:MAG: NlpC/P60 family protein [Candidatus Zixiibacteriota bacterium]|jgi:hypothetical protein
MQLAYVTTNLLDLWAEPRFESERVNQALFAEVVQVSSRQKGFARIVQGDGYSGWVDERQLTTFDRSRTGRPPLEANAIVTGRTAVLFGRDKRTAIPPFFIYYGTRIRTTTRSGDMARVILPDGGIRYVKAGMINPINRRMVENVVHGRIIAEARRFLGVPYLWGGITPAGFDCSGFIRAVLSRFSIDIPRDTKDQVKAGIRVDRDDVRTGDLLFFERHVGFAIGKQEVIHSSRGGGGVRINSLSPELPGYREDLDRTFNQARRLL